MLKKKVITLIFIIFLLTTLGACKKDTKTKPMSDQEVSEKLDSLKDYGLDLFQKADHLPVFKPEVTSEQTSSYSRNGNNVDGFGMDGNVDGEVMSLKIKRPLLILNQPGVVYRMWFTSWGENPILRILIDSKKEITYQISLFDLTSGLQEPFVDKLVFNRDESSGGYVSYVPIVFKESIEIYGSGDFYYNINYQKYPHGTELEYEDYGENLDKAVNILSNPGVDPKIDNNDQKIDSSIDLPKNSTQTIYEANEKQTVTSLRLKFPNLQVHELDRTLYLDDGYSLSLGSKISFILKAKSAGVHKLKFRGVLEEHDNQDAEVLVNGIKTSDDIHFRRRRFDGFEWKDDPFFMDSEVEVNIPSAGEYKIDIIAKSFKIGLFNARLYENGKQTDSIDFGNSKEEEKHKYSSVGLVSRTSRTLEYDPNSLINEATWEQIFKDEDLINQMFIRITYPDLEEVAVEAPISSFFGFGQFGMFKTLGIMVGLDIDGYMYSYYPMPFEKGIKIELINKSSQDINGIKVEVSHETNQFKTGTYGYFKTNYVENIQGTDSALRSGVPIEFLKVWGSGQVVGITHAQTGEYFGTHSRYYLEGDEQIYVDGNMSHSFHGTGTEDLYNGGWYFKNGVQNQPLFGQTTHNYRNNIDRTVMVRTYLTDPIYFRNGIDFKMEHGGNNDRPDSNVYALIYYYHQTREQMIKTDSLNLASLEEIENHSYKLDESSQLIDIGVRSLTYEGIYGSKRTMYNKVAIVNIESSFEMKIFKENDGAILRREYLPEEIDQMAEIYVDGELVGLWQSPHRNALEVHVRQDDFYIPIEFTKDKEKIKITIKVIPNVDTEVWTESYYEIYSIME